MKKKNHRGKFAYKHINSVISIISVKSVISLEAMISTDLQPLLLSWTRSIQANYNYSKTNTELGIKPGICVTFKQKKLSL